MDEEKIITAEEAKRIIEAVLFASGQPVTFEKLSQIIGVDEKTVKCVNHFSHNGNPLHDHICERAAEYGYLASYDGCQIEF